MIGLLFLASAAAAVTIRDLPYGYDYPTSAYSYDFDYPSYGYNYPSYGKYFYPDQYKYYDYEYPTMPWYYNRDYLKYYPRSTENVLPGYGYDYDYLFNYEPKFFWNYFKKPFTPKYYNRPSVFKSANPVAMPVHHGESNVRSYLPLDYPKAFGIVPAMGRSLENHEHHVHHEHEGIETMIQPTWLPGMPA